MLLIIDNYDSFTWNLYQYFSQCDMSIKVVRNDEFDLAALQALPLTHLVISPGPGTPCQSGISLEAINYFAGKIPILGVCLGHQAIAQVFGGRVIKAPTVMHGKTSDIYHDGEGLFHSLANPVVMTRYHSLIVDPATVPACLAVSAWCATRNGQIDQIMGLRHRELAIESVQFHPESIASEQGLLLLKNFTLQRS